MTRNNVQNLWMTNHEASGNEMVIHISLPRHCNSERRIEILLAIFPPDVTDSAFQSRRKTEADTLWNSALKIIRNA